MELIPYDPDLAMKRQIFEVLLFLRRMKTASYGFPPKVQKEVEMSHFSAAAQELEKVVTHVMRTDDRLVPDDPDRRG